MIEKTKGLLAVLLLTGNTFVQWLSDADTALKLLAALIAIPTAVFTGKFMYYQQKLKKIEFDRSLKDLE